MSAPDAALRRRPSRPSQAVPADTLPVTRAGFGTAERIACAVGVAWLFVMLFADWPALLRDTFDSSLSVDSAVFGYAGELIRRGAVPYLAFWDHKPPLVYFINAAGLVLSGGHPWGVWLLEFAAYVAAFALAFAGLRRVFGPAGAIMGSLLFAVGLASTPGANGTEGYALPLQWGAFWIWTRWGAGNRSQLVPGLVLGVLAAAAVLLRPNLIGAMVASAIVMSVVLLLERRIGQWLVFVAGGVAGVALVVLPLIAYLTRHGALAAFVEQVFTYNALYTSVSLTARAHAAYDGLRMASGYGVLALALVGWLLAAGRLIRRPFADAQFATSLLALVWLPIELSLASLSGRPYAHYFMAVILPLCFLSALALTALFNSSGRAAVSADWRNTRNIVVAAVLLAAILPAATDLVFRLRDNDLPYRRIRQIQPTAAYIQAHTSAGDPILVWGHAADLYFFAQRAPASRFIYPGPLLTRGYADSALVQGFLNELAARPPALIVDATGVTGFIPPEQLVPPLARWDPEWRYPQWRPLETAWWSAPPALERFYELVARDYRPVATIGPQGWTVYARSVSSVR